MASIKIEKQSANRKTALTNAPSTSARTQPKVFFLDCLRLDIWNSEDTQWDYGVQVVLVHFKITTCRYWFERWKYLTQKELFTARWERTAAFSLIAPAGFSLVYPVCWRKEKLTCWAKFLRCFFRRFFSQRIQLSIWLISMDFNAISIQFQLIDDPSTQWIQCKDQCKGFSAIHSRLSDWTQSAKKLDSGDSLNGPPLFVWVWGHGWILGIHFSIQCRWTLVIHLMDSMQRISARFQCTGYQWFDSWAENEIIDSNNSWRAILKFYNLNRLCVFLPRAGTSKSSWHRSLPLLSFAYVQCCRLSIRSLGCVVGWVVGLCGWRGGIGYYVCESKTYSIQFNSI